MTNLVLRLFMDGGNRLPPGDRFARLTPIQFKKKTVPMLRYLITLKDTKSNTLFNFKVFICFFQLIFLSLFFFKS